MKRFLSIALFGLLILSGCSSAPAEEEMPERHIVLADPGWDSVRFHNAVVGKVAEVLYNTTWEEVPGSTAITFEALKSGEIDVYTETWSDGIAPYADAVANGEIIEKGTNFDDNAQGLYVPAYIVEGDDALAPDLKTVMDLKEYANVFEDPDDPTKGMIYLAIPGWEVNEVLNAKMVAYGLDEFYNYMSPGSDSALAANITAFYEAGEPFVAYYWEPTWVTGKYDLVLLEDTPYTNEEDYYNGINEIPSMNVTVCTRAGFADDNPEMDAFLGNYTTSSQLTSNALAYMQDTGANYEDTAVWFMIQNKDLISSMLPAEDAEALFAAIE